MDGTADDDGAGVLDAACDGAAEDEGTAEGVGSTGVSQRESVAHIWKPL